MANLIKEQKLVDGHNRALLKYVITSDGSEEANTLLVDVSMLRGSLNANNMLMNTLSNLHIKTTYSTTIKRIFGSVQSAAGYVKLLWDGPSNNADIVTMGHGIFDYNFVAMGAGATIGNPQGTSNGDILITTAGLAADEAATIFIDLRKDNRDFAAGQFDDPTAFNR